MTFAGWVAVTVFVSAFLIAARTMFRKWTQAALDQQAAQLAKTFEANVLKLVDAKKTAIDKAEATKEQKIDAFDTKELEKGINE